MTIGKYPHIKPLENAQWWVTKAEIIESNKVAYFVNRNGNPKYPMTIIVTKISGEIHTIKADDHIQILDGDIVIKEGIGFSTLY